MSTAAPALAVVFWCSTAAIAFAYAGYPLIIYAFSRLFASAPTAPDAAGHDLPPVALLIAAHNESAVIGERIRNALSLDYPPDRLQIIVASDGSDDATAQISREFGPRVRVLAFTERRGKAATLNEAIQSVAAPIVVLSDANTHMRPDAVRRLAGWFADPRIGAVCGRLILTDPATGRNADSLYWRYETFLKGCEGRLGALLGANGAIYAIRRDLFPVLPPGTIVDDFVIPLLAKLRSSCRIVYDAGAVGTEETAPDVRAEFRRRTRIGTGGAQALSLLWSLLSPRHGWTAFSFLCHKVLRWAGPFFLVGMLLSAAGLCRVPLYRDALIGQLAFYAVCTLGASTCRRGPVARLLRLCSMFAGMNLALLVGFCRAARQRQTGIWARTARSAERPGLPDHEPALSTMRVPSPALNHLQQPMGLDKKAA